MRFKKINHILFFPTIPLSLFSNILHYICFILGQKKICMVTVICPTLLKTLDLNVFLQESAKITEDLLKLLCFFKVFFC